MTGKEGGGREGTSGVMDLWDNWSSKESDVFTGPTTIHSYLGGLRLLQSTCKKFYQYCSEHG